MGRTLHIHSDKPALAGAGAELFAALAAQAVSSRGRFSVALSGGGTPRDMYALLASRRDVPWNAVEFFFGDERMLPPGNRDTNFEMVRAALFDVIRPEPARVHRIDTSRPAPEAARAAEADLRATLNSRDGTPVLDLVLLGVGPDGHIASIFPGFPASSESRALVVATAPSPTPPHVERVTITLPLINAARNIVFVVAGADKQPVLSDIFNRAGIAAPSSSPGASIRFPAAMVREDAVWLVEHAAAPAGVAPGRQP